MNLLDYDNFIFDFDGTVMDSMPYWVSRPSSYIKYKNKTPNPDLDKQIYYFETLETAEFFKKEYNLDGSINDILADMKRWVYSEYKYNNLKKNSVELFKLLKSLNKKLFVLSASVYEIIDPAIDHKNIRSYFTDIFSATSNKMSKENGDAIKYLIKKHNLDKSKTILLDDSPLVLEVARKIGLETIGVKEDFYKQEEDKIKEVSSLYLSLDELYEMVKKSEN